ncbi:alpha-1,3-mannosyl-glycoprotein 4-beta-N-acetylglucosaminyltransferase-like protein MGAT4E isoform X2 [Erinaceus europaeus]|uniref:Alpha-1,3-mannosyl-glycoprotein 4-beta-N-acetylglucosaminyltransferase-like protein MGAT4E isoform X2 n=1 Tax=Erinaceus europaeus TaxID=9365 RepID=A0ABM3WF17_ERIEU|nr:alpha-1,3-mannosyl-glycoprotein 4-beta-N-acetylglucosaminyltransferase-like protein MGAT4E isoform X2 [Erinaceus europaeus]
MRCSLRCCCLCSVGLGLLWLLLSVKVCKDIEDNQNKMTPQEDIYSTRRALKQLEAWNNITFRCMQKSQQRRKTWLTVGICSAPGPHRSRLLPTLLSLFHASSKKEQKHLTVVVHLVGSDRTWLGETVAQISKLFSSQILAGRLLLIHAPPEVYPATDGTPEQPSPKEHYSRQNVDHAFLLSFASKLSDYFLLLDDNVLCAHHFVSHISAKVNAIKPSTWVLLEFSNMGFLGKLFHSEDLPRLAHFLLLFHKEKPLPQLLPRFRALLDQKESQVCRPFRFFPRNTSSTASHSPSDTAFDFKRSPSGPDNPPAAVFTDMKVFDVHFPWEAYTLDESFFWTYNISTGNHLTVLLNRPVTLRRVQVLTGTIVDGRYTLKKGQVELGFDPEGMPQFCTRFILLGQLMEGQLDQEVIQKDSAYNVSCVRLVVKASQASGLMVRHVYLWEDTGGETRQI